MHGNRSLKQEIAGTWNGVCERSWTKTDLDYSRSQLGTQKLFVPVQKLLFSLVYPSAVSGLESSSDWWCYITFEKNKPKLSK